MSLRDRFKAKVSDKKRDRLLKEAQERVDKVTKQANKCLKSSDFARYRNQLMEEKEKLYKLAEAYNEPDPTKYAFTVKTILMKTSTMGYMLEGVERDAHSG